jgi:hypothetical protein
MRGDIFGPVPRIYVTIQSLDVAARESILLSPLAEPLAPENVPLDSVQFNPLGTLLAVADRFGSLLIYDVDYIATQLHLRQTFPADVPLQGVSSRRIVALRWLHNDQKFHVTVKISKLGDQWSCSSPSQRGAGPCNTVGKEAFLAITADGKVCPLGTN